MRISRWGGWILVGVMAAGCLPFSGQASPHPAQPSPTASPVPSPTATSSATPEPATPTPQPSPTAPPQPTVTATIEALAGEWVLRTSTNGQRVAGVVWARSGLEFTYALTNPFGRFLLDWHTYELDQPESDGRVEHNFAYANFWKNAEVGYPSRIDPFSELQGYVSGDYEKTIFPTAGFPPQETYPNYIYLVYAGRRRQEIILGPTQPGKVERVVWRKYDTLALFDYRREDRTIFYELSIDRHSTDPVYEAVGFVGAWAVSPNEKYLLVPLENATVLIDLDTRGWPATTLPVAMRKPVWLADSSRVYYWDKTGEELLVLDLASQSSETVFKRASLREFLTEHPDESEDLPSFAVSPDGSWFALWNGHSIWLVRRAG